MLHPCHILETCRGERPKYLPSLETSAATSEGSGMLGSLGFGHMLPSLPLSERALCLLCSWMKVLGIYRYEKHCDFVG